MAPAAADPRLRDPVYVGGLDRCGKTTMSAFLTSHPRIAIPAVGSNMWTYFHGQYGDLGDDDNLDRCLADLLAYKHVRFLDPDPGRIRWEFRAGPPTYARLFALFLVHFAERQGKPRWGAQTGLIERYADHLVAAYPGVRIIHMVRDPRDRYEASLARWPDGKGRAGGAVARWRYSTALAERHQRRHPGQYLVVRFEDLVAEPERVLQRVCAFLREDFEPAMLAMPAAPKHRALLAGDAPVVGTVPLSDAFIGRHRDHVPPRELAFMQAQLRPRLQAYGYPVAPVPLSPADRVALALRDWPNQTARMVAWRTVEALQQWFPAVVRRRPGSEMIVEPVEVSA
jgi:hypothetical protein